MVVDIKTKHLLKILTAILKMQTERAITIHDKVVL